MTDQFQIAFDINNEAKTLGITLDRKRAEEVYSLYLGEKVRLLSENMEISQCEGIIGIINLAHKLNLKLTLFEAQNLYFNSIYNRVSDLIESIKISENIQSDKKFIATILNLGEKLNFNVEKHYADLTKLTSQLENNTVLQSKQ